MPPATSPLLTAGREMASELDAGSAPDGLCTSEKREIHPLEMKRIRMAAAAGNEMEVFRVYTEIRSRT